MNFFVGVTDYDWFLLHASKAGGEEVNFWRPSSTFFHDGPLLPWHRHLRAGLIQPGGVNHDSGTFCIGKIRALREIQQRDRRLGALDS